MFDYEPTLVMTGSGSTQIQLQAADEIAWPSKARMADIPEKTFAGHHPSSTPLPKRQRGDSNTGE